MLPDDDVIMALGRGNVRSCVIPSTLVVAALSFFRATPRFEWECVFYPLGTLTEH
jgi:hypothetical protein